MFHHKNEPAVEETEKTLNASKGTEDRSFIQADEALKQTEEVQKQYKQNELEKVFVEIHKAIKNGNESVSVEEEGYNLYLLYEELPKYGYKTALTYQSLWGLPYSLEVSWSENAVQGPVSYKQYRIPVPDTGQYVYYEKGCWGVKKSQTEDKSDVVVDGSILVGRCPEWVKHLELIEVPER